MSAPAFIRPDDWLTGVLGRPAFQVHVGASDHEAVATAVREHAAGGGPAFYFAKVGTSHVAAVAALSGIGMSVVEVNVSFGMSAVEAATRAHAPSVVHVHEALESERDDLLRIAASAYRHSRFHIDPLIPTETAHRIKREWLANYFSGRRGECVWTATMADKTVGFMAILGHADGATRVKVIDLIAVEPDAQGQGVGRVLVQHFLRHYAVTSDRLQVGTQIANIPSLRLYEGAGMKIERTTYTLHMHTQGSAS